MAVASFFVYPPRFLLFFGLRSRSQERDFSRFVSLRGGRRAGFGGRTLQHSPDAVCAFTRTAVPLPYTAQPCGQSARGLGKSP